MAEVDARMGGVKTAPARVVSRNPTMPAVAVVPWNPNPVVPFIPVAPAMIIRPIADRDFEADCFRLLRHRRRYRDDGRQENQNFLFHTLFDHLRRNLFGHKGYFSYAGLPRPIRGKPIARLNDGSR
jgi:hypothetical protein